MRWNSTTASSRYPPGKRIGSITTRIAKAPLLRPPRPKRPLAKSLSSPGRSRHSRDNAPGARVGDGLPAWGAVGLTFRLEATTIVTNPLGPGQGPGRSPNRAHDAQWCFGVDQRADRNATH